MNVCARLTHYALGTGVAVALLAGCSGSASEFTPSAPATQSRVAGHGKSWMSPRAATTSALLYVSDDESNSVFVYDYSTGASVGTLTGFDSPSGQCVDKKGDIWITNESGHSIVEYEHGGTKVKKTLTTLGASIGCGVSPSGDLAVANLYEGTGGQGSLEIFKDAAGTPARYTSPDCFSVWPPAYNSEGNLYLEGSTVGGTNYVCGIPAGGTKLQPVGILNAVIDHPGSVVWDGLYITLTDTGYDGKTETALYQAAPAESGDLYVVSTTVLSDPACNGLSAVDWPFVVGKKNTPANKKQGSAVVGSNVACGNASKGSPFDYWAYPAGGNPTSALGGGPASPTGSSVSIAKEQL